MLFANLKVSLLLANAYFSWKAWTPPVPPKSYHNELLKETEKKHKGAFIVTAVLLNVLYSALCITEAVTILALQYPTHPASQFILHTLLPSSLSHQTSNQLTTLQTLTGPFLLGTVSLLAGCLIRLHCFAQLGKLFTFDFCIRKDHELITSGLYSHLRHPSYTGVLLHYFGSVLAQLVGRGAWLRETGVLSLHFSFSWGSEDILKEGGKWVVAALVGWYLLVTTARAVYVFPRAIDEDKGLRKEFGEKWDKYAERVRYRIIPGVF
ncbi:hypothetical protein CVT26_003579 [Gymnopilus dilepis]|uniref:Protein-S-isoprenylcysteine O-methyltransferase n=1 Tax=Gymnopilus dilepis TaxID=231916 RepID=A0A409VS77_9AGAR|nr:hypothetical protein CVT26_003579 [Gymnopilus dilepis]